MLSKKIEAGQGAVDAAWAEWRMLFTLGGLRRQICSHALCSETGRKCGGRGSGNQGKRCRAPEAERVWGDRGMAGVHCTLGKLNTKSYMRHLTQNTPHGAGLFSECCSCRERRGHKLQNPRLPGVNPQPCGL